MEFCRTPALKIYRRRVLFPAGIPSPQESAYEVKAEHVNIGILWKIRFFFSDIMTPGRNQDQDTAGGTWRRKQYSSWKSTGV